MKKILISLLIGIISTSALADIRIIVPFAAGGAFDNMARSFALHVEETTKEKVIVENRTGAGSIVGTTALLDSDDYNNTVMLSSSSFFHNIVAGKFSKDQFTLASLLGKAPYIIITGSKNISCKDIKNAKTPIFVGTTGPGSGTAIAFEVVHKYYPNSKSVHYKGVSKVLVDLIPGRLDMSFSAGYTYKSRTDITHVATTSVDGYYGLPSWKQCLGINVDYSAEWVLVTNKKANDNFVEKINSLGNSFINSKAAKEKFNKDGIQAKQRTVKETNQYYHDSINVWSNLLK